MYKHPARKFALLTVLALVSITAVKAQTNTNPPPPPPAPATPGSVTGGDPVPTSPDIIQMILAVIHLA
jgi:hypothetical protein